MKKISDELLDILIAGVADYKKAGVIDPWVLQVGENGIITVEPLDVLIELKELRENNNPRKHSKPKKLKTDTDKSEDRPSIHRQQSKGKGLAD